MTEGGSDVSPDPASSTFALSSAPGVLQRGTDPSQDNMLPVPSVNCAHAKGGIKATNMNANIFLTHSEGLGSLTDGVIYTTQRYSKESTIATPRRPNSSSEPQSNRCVRKDPHRFLRPKRGGMTPWSRRRGAPTSAVKGDLYDRSIKSCAQQLKMSSVSKQNGDRNQPEQRPTTTTKRGGIGLEFLAFRDKFTEVAVRQAKAQVLLANHATSRREFALNLSKRRYRRLQADMLRSRLELADTLGVLETERSEHISKIKDAEIRRVELENALRAADQVLRQLTTEIRNQRSSAEERETFLAARLGNVRTKLEQSRAVCRREKLSTWTTVGREIERAASRERYRMTAFLQRYIVENEYLRASISGAQEEASGLRERLQKSEDSVERLSAIVGSNNNFADGGNQRFASVARSWGGGSRATQGGSDEQQQQRKQGSPQRGLVTTGDGIAGEGRDLARNAEVTVTQAEMVARRLNDQILPNTKSGLGVDCTGGDRDCEKSSKKNSVGMKETRRRLRELHGRAAELSVLLAATEGERDSLASLLVLAERKMERMVLEQEKLAMSMAWDAVADRSRGSDGTGAGGKSGRRQRSIGGSFDRSSGGVARINAELRSVVRNSENSAEHIASTVAVDKMPSLLSEIQVAGTLRGENEGKPIAAVSISSSSGRRELENIELKRRLRDLELLLRAAEIEQREAESENMAFVPGIGVSTSRQPEDTTAGESRYAVATSGTNVAPADEDDNMLIDDPTRSHRQRGGGGGGTDGTVSRDLIGRPEQYIKADSMMSRQLAWVLGLPHDHTTEHDILVEVLHLVVERGNARTDASTLETQLAKIDEEQKSSYRTRLAAANATDAVSEGVNVMDGDHLTQQAVITANRAADAIFDSRSHHDYPSGLKKTPASGDDRSPTGGAGIHSSHCIDPSMDAHGGVNKGENHGSRPGQITKIESPPEHPPKSNFGSSFTAGHANVNTKHNNVLVATAISAIGGRPRKCENPTASQKQSMKVSGQTWEPVTNNNGKCDESQADAKRYLALLSASTPEAADVVEGDVQRATFPKMMQGRVVSIDVFCTKVPSNHMACKEEESKVGTASSMLLGDDDDYKITVEVYDSTVLKRHTLIVYEEDIKRCFVSQPHLYTLGPCRRRVHQSLAERLTFMSEQDVRAKLERQRGNRQREDMESATPTATGGSTGLPGGQGSADPNQLLVLLGDAGEIVLVENHPSSLNTDVNRNNRVHRFAKNTIMQIEKEEEVVEGVVFQYEPPLLEVTDPVAAELAKALSTMESDHSSPSLGDSYEYYDDGQEYSSEEEDDEEEDEEDEDEDEDDDNDQDGGGDDDDLEDDDDD